MIGFRSSVAWVDAAGAHAAVTIQLRIRSLTPNQPPLASARAAATFALRIVTRRYFTYHRPKLTLLLGSRLGPYEVVALLGAGGMGEVCRVRDTRVARTSTDIFSYDVSADGRRFLINMDDGPSTSPPLTVMLDWAAKLRPLTRGIA